MESDNDSSIEEKQEFLRESVLDKGLDANSFADYLVSKRGEEGSNLDTWSMNELKLAVKEFIEINESKKKESEKEDDENENIIIENEDKIENEINEKEIKDNKLNEKEGDNIPEKEKSKKKSKKESEKEIKIQNETKIENVFPPEIYGILCPPTFECKPLENTPLSSIENLIITISSPEKKEGGFFSNAYITYLITTKEPNLNVRRRYSDFVWFHQKLLDLYPYVVIPPIPKKNKIGVDNFSNVFINKRMRYLEKFLKWLAANPIIKCSQIFYDFLSIEKAEDLNKKKSEYQKLDKPMNLIEFYAKNGKMNLGINKEKETYFNNISNNNTNNEILLENLNFNLKQLKILFDLFIQKIDEVQKKWEQLFLNSTKFFEDINISNTYEKMSKLFINWSDSLKQQNKLIFVDIREFFKYVKNNYRDMKINIENVKNVKNEYYKFERNLIYRKEDLFKKGDVTKWELDPQEKANPNSLLEDKLSALFKMCAKETDRCVQRKIYYGYYLNQLIEEYERISKFYGHLYKENQLDYCKQLSVIITEFHNHIIENFSTFVIEKK